MKCIRFSRLLAVLADLCHLNAKSYETWAEAIEPTVAKLMGEK